MTWTSPKELKAQLTQLWERGELLRDLVNGNTRFPLCLSLKRPAPADITSHFHQVRDWAAELAALPFVRLEWEERRHRIQGTQTLPVRVWVHSLEDALTWLNKRTDWACFSAQLDTTRQTHSALLPWLERRPMQVLQLVEEWPQLLAVVAWVCANPKPGIYLRQVDLPGLHSKFIEAHRSVLAELLDLALPPTAVDTSKNGISQFSARYGFLEKPIRIRFRLLDPAIEPMPRLECPDITLDSVSFSRLNLGTPRVFITENETNFLSFPPVKNSIVIFGAGYCWDALANSDWLKHCPIHYWGDIDTHGFGILDQLRRHFNHVVSFLMDRPTLHAHTASWGHESKSLHAELTRLTPDEKCLYDDLRHNRIRAGLRLEQEHVNFHWLIHHLDQLEGLTVPKS